MEEEQIGEQKKSKPMISADKLSLVTGEGSCPSVFPSANAEEWVR